MYDLLMGFFFSLVKKSLNQKPAFIFTVAFSRDILMGWNPNLILTKQNQANQE